MWCGRMVWFCVLCVTSGVVLHVCGELWFNADSGVVWCLCVASGVVIVACGVVFFGVLCV